MKRFSLKLLLFIVAIVAFGLWFCFVKTEYTISLPDHVPGSIQDGANISIIHSTKGVNTPVFYVKNEPVIEALPRGKNCDFTFRATALERLSLWMQGYENLQALPGTHD